LSLACQDQVVPLPVAVHCDMRARTARLCAAAVGGGRRLMRLPMALSMGRFGLNAASIGLVLSR
jgi:hypothetical protein